MYKYFKTLAFIRLGGWLGVGRTYGKHSDKKSRKAKGYDVAIESQQIKVAECLAGQK
jgi:hypothetical protein